MRTRVLTLNAKRWKILRPYDLLIHRPLIPFPYHFLILSSTLPPTPTSLNLSMNPPYITLVKVLESFWCGISTLGPSLISYASFLGWWSRICLPQICAVSFLSVRLNFPGWAITSSLTLHTTQIRLSGIPFLSLPSYRSSIVPAPCLIHQPAKVE